MCKSVCKWLWWLVWFVRAAVLFCFTLVLTFWATIFFFLLFSPSEPELLYVWVQSIGWIFFCYQIKMPQREVMKVLMRGVAYQKLFLCSMQSTKRWNKEYTSDCVFFYLYLKHTELFLCTEPHTRSVLHTWMSMVERKRPLIVALWLLFNMHVVIDWRHWLEVGS